MAAIPNKGAGSYHVLDFQNLNEKGLAGLVKAVKQAGTEIAETIPAGPARKKDGVPVKQFSLVDLAGQTMTFTVTELGDIAQVTLNGKVVPETSPTSLQDLAAKISAGFSKTAEAFQASLARKAAKLARQEADTERKKSQKTAVKTQGQRLNEATEKLTAAQNTLNDIQQTVTQRLQAKSGMSTQLQQIQQQLQNEIALTATLKQQISELQGAANV